MINRERAISADSSPNTSSPEGAETYHSDKLERSYRGGYIEASAEKPQIQLEPLSHLSVEFLHLYAPDFQRPVEDIASQLILEIALADAFIRCREQQMGRPLKKSGYIMIDDYEKPAMNDMGPLKVMHDVLLPAIEMAETVLGRTGVSLTVDYFGREAAAASYYDERLRGENNLAEIMINSLSQVPVPDTQMQSQPWETGFISNGKEAKTDDGWEAPEEALESELAYTSFKDIELFRDIEPTKRRKEKWRKYSCPGLAGVWQLLRLNQLYVDTEQRVRVAGVVPQQMPDTSTLRDGRWKDLPALWQRTESPDPFSAYRTLSVLAPRYASVEDDGRVITGSFTPNPQITEYDRKFAAAEGLTWEYLPDRSEYQFIKHKW